jgi:hypothetical protein
LPHAEASEADSSGETLGSGSRSDLVTLAAWLAPAIRENPVHRGLVPLPGSADLGLVPIRRRLNLHLKTASVTGLPAVTASSP